MQWPSQLPSGNRKPYFMFGDAGNSVDVWYVDLAKGLPQQFVGRGSDAIEASDTILSAASCTTNAITPVLRAVLDGRAETEIPVLRQLAEPLAQVEARARALAARLAKAAVPQLEVAVEAARSPVGGGSLPRSWRHRCSSLLRITTGRDRRREAERTMVSSFCAWPRENLPPT